MLSLVLPTYNEAENLQPLLRELRAALGHREYEVIVVDDDSPDRTWEKAEALRSEYPMLRVIRRQGRRGLSSAVVEGFQAAHGDILAVMDADGQHDPHLLPAMLAAVHDGVDLVIGSRYARGGSVGEWHLGRKLLSSSGTLVTRIGLRRRVTDPLSGFFVMQAEVARPLLKSFSPEGFKILLDLLVRLPRQAVIREIPFVFRKRLAGESKLTFAVHLAVLRTLWPLLLRRVGLWLFVSACIVLSVVFLAQIWRIRLVYLDPDIRERVRADLQEIADDHGFLLSDISLRSVEASGFTFTHRPHQRGRDIEPCSYHHLFTASIVPCEAE